MNNMNKNKARKAVKIARNLDTSTLQKSVFGYPIRKPNKNEEAYFRQNPNVAGMAADDMHIILNPYSPNTLDQQQRVTINEAVRLSMREHGDIFTFDVPQINSAPFAGSIYADPSNKHHLQSTIIARIISGDTSAGEVTPEQRVAADMILFKIEGRTLSKN